MQLKFYTLDVFTEVRFGGNPLGVVMNADALPTGLMQDIARETESRTSRPRVYFEEWNDPMISGIGWVSELIGIAGGIDIFAGLGTQPAAKDRIVTSEQVIAGRPDVILASWCGKKVRLDSFKAREGWSAIPAVADGRIVEIKSPLILQPGPAALTDGLDAIRAALAFG